MGAERFDMNIDGLLVRCPDPIVAALLLTGAFSRAGHRIRGQNMFFANRGEKAADLRKPMTDRRQRHRFSQAFLGTGL
jgi:hypothetical protein